MQISDILVVFQSSLMDLVYLTKGNKPVTKDYAKVLEITNTIASNLTNLFELT